MNPVRFAIGFFIFFILFIELARYWWRGYNPGHSYSYWFRGFDPLARPSRAGFDDGAYNTGARPGGDFFVTR